MTNLDFLLLLIRRRQRRIKFEDKKTDSSKLFSHSDIVQSEELYIDEFLYILLPHIHQRSALYLHLNEFQNAHACLPTILLDVYH